MGTGNFFWNFASAVDRPSPHRRQIAQTHPSSIAKSIRMCSTWRLPTLVYKIECEERCPEKWGEIVDTTPKMGACATTSGCGGRGKCARGRQTTTVDGSERKGTKQNKTNQDSTEEESAFFFWHPGPARATSDPVNPFPLRFLFPEDGNYCNVFQPSLAPLRSGGRLGAYSFPFHSVAVTVQYRALVLQHT